MDMSKLKKCTSTKRTDEKMEQKQS